jgi:hypothetical protein
VSKLGKQYDLVVNIQVRGKEPGGHLMLHPQLPSLFSATAP